MYIQVLPLVIGCYGNQENIIMNRKSREVFYYGNIYHIFKFGMLWITQ